MHDQLMLSRLSGPRENAPSRMRFVIGWPLGISNRGLPLEVSSLVAAIPPDPDLVYWFNKECVTLTDHNQAFQLMTDHVVQVATGQVRVFTRNDINRGLQHIIDSTCVLPTHASTQWRAPHIRMRIPDVGHSFQLGYFNST